MKFTPSALSILAFAAGTLTSQADLIGLWEFNQTGDTGNPVAVSGASIGGLLLNSSPTPAGGVAVQNNTANNPQYLTVAPSGMGYDSTNGYLYFAGAANGPPLRTTDNFSVWARVRRTANSGVAFQSIVGMPAVKNNKYSICVDNSDGLVKFRYDGLENSGGTLLASTASLPVGSSTFVDVGVSFERTSAGTNPSEGIFRFYVNGIQVGSDLAVTNFTSTDVLHMGAGGAGVQRFLGHYDEVRFWNTTESASTFLGLSTPDDSDGDMLPDSWEIGYFGSIATQDGDDDSDTDTGLIGGAPSPDGSTNLQEYTAGSNPLNPASTPLDVDADTLADAWEMANFLTLSYGPNDDPDGDFDSNSAEEDALTNPLLRTSHTDTDLPTDGISDTWEQFYFPGVGTAATDDDDLDSVSSLQEFLRGTNPLDKTSTGEADGDADNDGLDDAWERTYFYNVLAQSGADDSDTIEGTFPGTAAPDGANNLEEYTAGTNPLLPTSTPTDINGDGIADVVLSIPLTSVGSGGGILDKDGEATGFSTRLAGTGASLPSPNDTNLDLDTTNGLLSIASTTSDFHGQGNMGIAEAFGVNLSTLGFTGSEDFKVRARFVDLPAFGGYDQLGVFAGNASNSLIRGGLINWGSTGPLSYGVNNNGGADSSLITQAPNLLAPGSTMTVELSRTGGVWAISVNGVVATPSADPDFLDSLTDLTVGVFHLDVFTGPQTAKLDSFFVVRFGSAVVDPDSDDDGMPDIWETAKLGGTSQSGTDDADKDGVLNLAEFAFNGDPQNGSSLGGVSSAVQSSYLTITVPVLAGATFGDGPNGTQTVTMGGITYIIRGSLDLQNFISPVEFVSKTVSGDPDYELHTFRLPASLNLSGKGFLQALVTTP
jgi:hypothetical protein